jgi:SAM-dependent methyltransferase
MNLLEQVHEGYVHRRRVRVLSRCFAALIPGPASVLDVGCGDGLLARLLQQQRPDLTVHGIDVVARPGARVPVQPFDGRVIPYEGRRFDVVMFVDVLHHTEDPLVLLREAARVAGSWILVKDHLLQGLLAGPTLGFMDRVGNTRHGVSLPFNYWPRRRWLEAFATLGLTVDAWQSRLGLYPWPASLLFDRSLHFVARLRVAGGG